MGLIKILMWLSIPIGMITFVILVYKRIIPFSVVKWMGAMAIIFLIFYMIYKLNQHMEG